MFVLGWIGIAIVVTALTKAVPHSLRILVSLPAWLILLTFGWESVLQWLTKQSRVITLAGIGTIIVGYSVLFAQYWRYYTMIYPIQAASEWQFGYREMIAELSRLEQAYPELPVYISRSEGRPAMYYWFMNQTNPRLVQSLDSSSAQDQGEFLTFGDIQFVAQPLQSATQSAIVAVGVREDTDSASLTESVTIRRPDGVPVWIVGRKE